MSFIRKAQGHLGIDVPWTVKVKVYHEDTSFPTHFIKEELVDTITVKAPYREDNNWQEIEDFEDRVIEALKELSISNERQNRKTWRGEYKPIRHFAGESFTGEHKRAYIGREAPDDGGYNFFDLQVLFREVISANCTEPEMEDLEGDLDDRLPEE